MNRLKEEGVFAFWRPTTPITPDLYKTTDLESIITSSKKEEAYV